MPIYLHLDIDECSSSDPNTPKCDHTCTNQDGGFLCVCNPGYQLEGITTCKGIYFYEYLYKQIVKKGYL